MNIHELKAMKDVCILNATVSKKDVEMFIYIIESFDYTFCNRLHSGDADGIRERFKEHDNYFISSVRTKDGINIAFVKVHQDY